VSQDQLGLFDTPPDRRQVRAAIVVVTALFAAFLAMLPFRDVRLGEVTAFVPVVDAAMFLGEMITATLLYAQARIFRSRALTALATGYVFSGLLLVPHALTLPGAFSHNGLLGAGLDTTAWIGLVRRAAFPVAGLLYVCLKQAEAAVTERERRSAGTLGGVLAGVGGAAAVTALTTLGQVWLPPYFSSRSDLIYQNAVWYQAALIAMLIVTTIVLFRNRRSVLDLWLLVAFASWILEILFNINLKARFTTGFYSLFGISLFSHLVLMLALVVESNLLYARLALSIAARNRERDARLMSVDAVAAAISHEIGQPLTGVTMHARAGLNWLTRHEPDVERAIHSLRATVDAGQRTTDVVKSIRAMFARRPGTATDFSLNELLRETVALLERELASKKVSLQVALDETLPPIHADRVQMQRLLVNLFTNAIESVGATRGRTRRIAIRSEPLEGQDVLVEIDDNGVGIPPEQMARIFEAFVTTKVTGTGLGLWLCRTIVESHGGRLWASPGVGHGATFHLQLPRSGTLTA
jgi:signal transduction histidine kinase